MKKSVIAWLLLASMTLPLASCSSSAPDTPAPSDDSAAAEPVTDTTAETEPPEYTAPGKTFDGKTFTFLDYQTEDYAYYIQTFSDIHADANSGDSLSEAQYERNQTVQELLDFKLQTHPVGGRKRDQNDKELTNLILAADTSVDAAFVFSGKMATLLTTPGQLVKINTIQTLNLDASWWDQNQRRELTVYGGVKAITGDISLFTQYAPNVVYFNKEVADNAHLENLYDTVRAGKWTLDKMIEASAAVSADLDGDGTRTDKDRYGLLSQYTFFNPIFYSAGGDVTRATSDGGIELCLNSERTASFVSKVVPFYSDKNAVLLANNVSAYGFSNSDAWLGLFAPMFANNQALFYMNQLVLLNDLRAQEPDFGVIPYPKFDEAQQQYRTNVNGSWATMLCVPATCTKLDMAGYVFDAMGYYSQKLVIPEIIDKNVRGKSIRDEDSAEMLSIILSNKSFGAIELFGWGGITTSFYQLAQNNDTNFASMYASAESATKAAISATLEEFKKDAK